MFSSDNAKWTELDRRDGDTSLHSIDAVSSFAVRTVRECRYIRLRQTGLSSRGDDYLIFQALELFGGLRIPGSVKL
jgi:hypothetical protein